MDALAVGLACTRCRRPVVPASRARTRPAGKPGHGFISPKLLNPIPGNELYCMGVKSKNGITDRSLLWDLWVRVSASQTATVDSAAITIGVHRVLIGCHSRGQPGIQYGQASTRAARLGIERPRLCSERPRLCSVRGHACVL